MEPKKEGNSFEEDIALTPEESLEEKARLDGIVQKVELDIAKISEARKNRSLVRKILDSTGDFIREKGDLILYTASGSAMTYFAAQGVIENFEKTPNVAAGYGVLSLAMAFTTGVFFERYRTK
ncbi:MAG: hypothetical protein AABW58_03035 [Nanoarchaeota archaeon]